MCRVAVAPGTQGPWTRKVSWRENEQASVRPRLSQGERAGPGGSRAQVAARPPDPRPVELMPEVVL